MDKSIKRRSETIKFSGAAREAGKSCYDLDFRANFCEFPLHNLGSAYLSTFSFPSVKIIHFVVFLLCSDSIIFVKEKQSDACNHIPRPTTAQPVDPACLEAELLIFNFIKKAWPSKQGQRVDPCRNVEC